jgi:hypothetical protein
MRTSHYSVLCLSIVAMACAKTADKAVDSPKAAPAPAPAPPAPTPAISLADVAGKWQLVSTPTEGKDTTATKSTLTTTSDTSGWTMTFAGRKPVKLHVRTDGDSVISTSEPYQSVRRKGVQVTTNSVFRLQGGKLQGTTTAHYSKGADSVLHLRSEGTKAP